PTRCASTCPQPLRCWSRSPPPTEHGNSKPPFAACIPGARTSAWIMHCWSHARRAEKPPATSTAFRLSLRGMTWARGRRSTSTRRRTAATSSAPGSFVAAVGVNDLVVVETDDALLITTRECAQDVGKVVKYLDKNKLTKLV